MSGKKIKVNWKQSKWGTSKCVWLKKKNKCLNVYGLGTDVRDNYYSTVLWWFEHTVWMKIKPQTNIWRKNEWVKKKTGEITNGWIKLIKTYQTAMYKEWKKTKWVSPKSPPTMIIWLLKCEYSIGSKERNWQQVPLYWINLTANNLLQPNKSSWGFVLLHFPPSSPPSTNIITPLQSLSSFTLWLPGWKFLKNC